MPNPTLEQRVRTLLIREPVSEKKMFGGVCFLFQGNMLCGITKTGKLMARVGKALEPEARALPGAQDMDFTGKKMGGMLFVAETGVMTENDLSAWVEMCLRFARPLPAK